MPLAVHPDRLVRTGCGGGRKHRGMVDRRGDDSRPDPSPAECDAGHGSLRGLHPGTGEDHLVRTGTDRRRDDLPSLVEGLRGKPSTAVQPRGITPAGLLRDDPGLPCLRQHRLARTGVEEDLGNRLRHTLKLTPLHQ